MLRYRFLLPKLFWTDSLTDPPYMRTRLSVFLIALSGLVLEVGLTRIYSASVWYHFAFVAISVALLGWGLGGFTVHVLKRQINLSLNSAALVASLYAGTIPLCLWEWESQLKKGEQIVLAAFGGGFTWGATLVKWAYGV